MTACAAFMPTKASAATLRIAPRNEIAAKPGDLIDFIFSVRPETGSEFVLPTKLDANFDTSELEEVTPLQFLFSLNLPLTFDRPLASWRLRVKNPVKDGIPDVSGTLFYDEKTLVLPEISTGLSIPASGADVVPVPEPLTIFGTAIGLGCGVLFKRKSFKKTVS
jgi:hypothetical protein